MKKLGSLFALVVIVFGTSFKPKAKLFDGSIKYAIDYHADYGVTKYPQDLTIHIKGDLMRIDVSLPFAEMTYLIDSKKRTSVKLCKIDGVNYKISSELKKPLTIEKIIMAKDSTKTVKDLPCIFGRISNKTTQFTVYATTKYIISKNISACGPTLPYNLFFPQKELESKLCMQVDMYDDDGETTYVVESISESAIKDADILPSISEYKEITDEALGKIMSDYFRSMH
jgi:hypothetical protein